MRAGAFTEDEKAKIRDLFRRHEIGLCDFYNNGEVGASNSKEVHERVREAFPSAVFTSYGMRHDIAMRLPPLYWVNFWPFGEKAGA